MSIFYRHILVVFITINLSTKHKFILFFWAWAILKPSWKAVTQAGEAEALLQAFGLSVGSCGLANVLQCGWVSLTDPKGRSGPAKTNFFLQYVSIKVNIFSVLFFNFQIMLSMYRCLFSLAHNGRRLWARAVCGRIRCRTTTKWMREQNPPKCTACPDIYRDQPANAYSVCWTKFPPGRAFNC